MGYIYLTKESARSSLGFLKCTSLKSWNCSLITIILWKHIPLKIFYNTALYLSSRLRLVKFVYCKEQTSNYYYHWLDT
jgi:hypothetical protein